MLTAVGGSTDAVWGSTGAVRAGWLVCFVFKPFENTVLFSLCWSVGHMAEGPLSLLSRSLSLLHMVRKLRLGGRSDRPGREAGPVPYTHWGSLCCGTLQVLLYPLGLT